MFSCSFIYAQYPATQQKLESGAKGIVQMNYDGKQLEEFYDTFESFGMIACNGYVFYLTDTQIEQLKKSDFSCSVLHKGKEHQINRFNFSSILEDDIYILNGEELSQENKTLLNILIPTWENKTIIREDFFLIDKNQFNLIKGEFKLDIIDDLYIDKDKNVFILKISDKKQEKYSKLRIDLDRSKGKDLKKLYELGLDVEHGHYHRNEFFESDFSVTEIEIIENAGFTYTTLVDDVISYYANQQQFAPSTPENGSCETNTVTIDYQTPANWSLGSMGGYITYQEMLDHLDSMASKYPNLISARQPIDVNKMTHDGHYIYWLRISDNPNIDETEPEILYDALHHAREPGSMAQLIFYMWYLLENYGTDPEVTYLVDNTEMYFVPCVNPDGYIYNELTNPNGGGLWRKNRRQNASGDFGVDLNRNYGYEWGHDNTGSSPNSTSNTYRGPSAFSEPETQNMRDFAMGHEFKIAMNYHTYGNLLVYPWGYSDQLTPDSTTFIQFSDVMTRQNDYLAGTGTQTVGYVVNGDSDDWMYGDTISKDRIISMTPEAGYSFWASINDIESICKDNMYQNLMAAHLLLNYGEYIDQANLYVNTTSGHLRYDMKKYGFEAGNLTVSFTPVSNNILTIGGNPVTYTLNQFESTVDSVNYTLTANITDGEEIKFLVSVDNGLWTMTDTITKVYSFGTSAVSFADDLSNTQNWTTSGAWNTTTSSFYSSPSSMTDSPLGDYSANASNRITIANPVDLSNAVSATLKFWTRWRIEPIYDYVQMSGASINSSPYEPLCGLYTKTGGQYQAFNEPVYDGTQLTWVEEEVDLVDYLGGDFYLRFLLQSDGLVEEDGYYFDDVRVEVTTTTGTETISINNFVLEQNRPNPAKNFTTIELQNSPNNAQLVIYSTLGQEVFRTVVQNNLIEINTSDWNTGVYFYRIESTEGVSTTFKMEVMK